VRWKYRRRVRCLPPGGDAHAWWGMRTRRSVAGGGGRRTRTEGRPPVAVAGSTAETRLGAPQAVVETSSQSGLAGRPLALERGSTDGDLSGGPPAGARGCSDAVPVCGPLVCDGRSTQGDRVRGPPVLERGTSNGGSHDRRVGPQTAARQVTADERDACRQAISEQVGFRDLRGPYHVGGGRGGEHLDGGILAQDGRHPKAADCPASPMKAGRKQGGVVDAAA